VASGRPYAASADAGRAAGRTYETRLVSTPDSVFRGRSEATTRAVSPGRGRRARATPTLRPVPPSDGKRPVTRGRRLRRWSPAADGRPALRRCEHARERYRPALCEAAGTQGTAGRPVTRAGRSGGHVLRHAPLRVGRRPLRGAPRRRRLPGAAHQRPRARDGDRGGRCSSAGGRSRCGTGRSASTAANEHSSGMQRSRHSPVRGYGERVVRCGAAHGLRRRTVSQEGQRREHGGPSRHSVLSFLFAFTARRSTTPSSQRGVRVELAVPRLAVNRRAARRS
jgi:hypothetical protein